MNDEAIRIGRAAAWRVSGMVAPGLTDAEFDRVENEFGFEFADDHRALLAEVLPLNKDWPDWRDGDAADLRERLQRPVQGVLFDVEHNRMWKRGWGERPKAMPEALLVARERLAEVPTLVPVYSHRYLPAGRGTWGHPVLSVMQTDIIYYGTDLADYIQQESRGYHMDPHWEPAWKVAFWGDFV